MNKKLIYIGLDVDDTQYHAVAFDYETDEIVSYKYRPALKVLVASLPPPELLPATPASFAKSW